MNDTRHLITDAHGRPIDLTSNGHAAAPAHTCTAHPQRRTPAVVLLAAVLVGGLLLALLLIVIRDIATTLIGTSFVGTALGIALKALLTRANRRER
jgi:ABC-type cobalamin transport system permease subunit